MYPYYTRILSWPKCEGKRFKYFDNIFPIVSPLMKFPLWIHRQIYALIDGQLELFISMEFSNCFEADGAPQCTWQCRVSACPYSGIWRKAEQWARSTFIWSIKNQLFFYLAVYDVHVSIWDKLLWILDGPVWKH